VEGFTSVIASMVGCGTGLSSFRDSVGALDVTKVDSFLLPCIANIIYSQKNRTLYYVPS